MTLTERLRSGKGADREFVRQSRNAGKARWNRLRSTLAQALPLTKVHFDDISIETMAEMRDLVNDISQQFHEANAYRNSYLALLAAREGK